jgi:integrase
MVKRTTTFMSSTSRTSARAGRTGRRELPQPALEALRAWPAASGREFGTMSADDSLWPSLSNGRGITSGTFYGNLRRYLKKAGLPLSGVHVFRH